jgi:hypothetical protein
VVRRSRKPWIGVLVATCSMGPSAVAGAVTDQAPTQLPPPVAGKTVNAQVRAGKVRYRLPGTSAFVVLTDPQQLPIGTTFDTTAGRVTLTSASDTKGATQHAWFYEGTFTLGQTTGPQPITTLALAGTLPSCSKGSGGRAAATTRKRKSRHLWGDGKGRFRTSGRFASATVRGTRWVVSDRCDGTLIRVVRGSVTVRDRVRSKTVVIREGEQYLVRRPGSTTP